MFITKKHLSRRTVLRGMGVRWRCRCSIPWCPRRRHRGRPRRIPDSPGLHRNGARRGRQHRRRDEQALLVAREGGRDFEMSQTLEPLEPYRDYLTIVSDTDLHPATAWAAAEEGADHFRSSAVYLTAAHPKMTEGSDISSALRSISCTRRSSARTRRCPRFSSVSKWWTRRAPAITATLRLRGHDQLGFAHRSRCR